MEQSHTTGFAPASTSTPYGHPAGDPPLEYPPASPPGEATHMFMALLSHLMHLKSDVPCTPLHNKGLVLLSVPYPYANLPTVPNTFIHFPNPCWIVVDHPLTSTVRGLTMDKV